MPYDPEFYDLLAADATRSANCIVPAIITLLRPRSVVDVGCGEGAWLRVFFELGVTDFLGLDGKHIEQSRLQIPDSHFRAVSLTQAFSIERSFDLAICLEVAEHLEAAASGRLIDALCGCAPVVLFSAAIPGQGGTRHVNEQWPDYWAALFGRHGFACFDILRSRFWEREDVAWWYRQNLFLFVKADTHAQHSGLAGFEAVTSPARLVHPALFETSTRLLQATIDRLRRNLQDPGVRLCMRGLLTAARRRLLSRRADSPAADSAWPRARVVPAAAAERRPLGISVIVCCHNAASRLPETIGHLARQDAAGVPWEVVVVDNASSDDTVRVAESLWPSDATLLRVVQEPALGLSNARARGIDAARYEFVALVDDDNWLESDWVQNAFAIMRSDAGIGACGGRNRPAFEDPAPAWFKAVETSYAVGSRGAQAKDLGDADGWLWGAGLVLRRTAWERLRAAGFKQQIPDRTGTALISGGDAELCLALRRAGWKLRYDPGLRLTHYMPRQRLCWSYYVEMIRGCGRITPMLDPLQPSLPRLNRRGQWLQRNWIVQAVLTLRQLAKSPVKALRLRSLREGDPDTAWIETKIGRLQTLLKERSRYRARFDADEAVRWEDAGPGVS